MPLLTVVTSGQWMDEGEADSQIFKYFLTYFSSMYYIYN